MAFTVKPKEMIRQEQDYQTAISKQELIGTKFLFETEPQLKASYTSWSWCYQEIANLRAEVSRLGILVRINNSNSPQFLAAYHAHIYSLLIPISVIIPEKHWVVIEKLWMQCKEDMDIYLQQSKIIPNKKIPFIIIRKLDKLYRVALLVAQRAGMGISMESNMDITSAVESVIVGS